jgi:hypothetical protein
MSPVHHLQEALMRVNAIQRNSGNQGIPVEAMMAADDTVSKEFPKFLEIIQKEGIQMSC